MHDVDDEFVDEIERLREERFLALIQVGADAIHEKRRLQGEVARLRERCARLEKLVDEGLATSGSLVGDLVVGLCSGVLKIDKSVPLPDRFKEKPDA